MKEFKDLFVDSDEQQLAVLGGGYLRNYISSGNFSKGFCIVSNKRAYFKGKCYYKDSNGHFKAGKEERIVDLDNITGSGFIHGNIVPWFVKLICLIFTLLSAIIEASFLSDLSHGDVVEGSESNWLVSLTFLFLSTLIVFGISCLFRSKLFEINYAGGGIAFRASNYSEQEMQEFNVALRRAKDNFVTYRNAQTVYQPTPQQVTVQSSDSVSVTGELKEYKELLDSGAITQEEYDKVKQKLLS